MTAAKLRLAVASMNQPETRIGDLYAELGITLRMRRSIRPKLRKATIRRFGRSDRRAQEYGGRPGDQPV